MEVLSKALDGLAAPRPPPTARWIRGRRRSAAATPWSRRCAGSWMWGSRPPRGGERPHVTVTMDLEALRGQLGTAVLDHGGPITAAQARMLPATR